MSTAIRRYAPADEARVVELSLAAWAPVFASFREILGPELDHRVHPDWRASQATSVREALERHETWVSVDGDAVTGFVNVSFDPEGASAEIYMIAVDPASHRQGIGGRLTEFALGEMRSRGVTLAIVATGGDPGHAPARATYERAGFTGIPQVWYAKLLS